MVGDPTVFIVMPPLAFRFMHIGEQVLLIAYLPGIGADLLKSLDFDLYAGALVAKVIVYVKLSGAGVVYMAGFMRQSAGDQVGVLAHPSAEVPSPLNFASIRLVRYWCAKCKRK